VRLVPYAPIPIAYSGRTPAFHGAPHHIAAPLCKPPDGSRIIGGARGIGGRDHRWWTPPSNRPPLNPESLPPPHPLGRVLIKKKDSYDPRLQLAEASPDPFPAGPDSKVPPTIRLVDAVAQTHSSFATHHKPLSFGGQHRFSLRPAGFRAATSARHRQIEQTGRKQ